MFTSQQQKISIVISTLGRSLELIPMLESLSSQTLKPSEIIIVDQNDDTRIDELLSSYKLDCSIKHLHHSEMRGLSNGRNAGWEQATGDFVLFADDDCWYPTDFLEKGLCILQNVKADIICGRAADDSGRSINGRFEGMPQWVNRSNIWTTQIEWVVLFRRVTLQLTEGYAAHIGIGAASPWQSAEGQEITLNALSKGAKIYYDPNWYGHHAEMPTQAPTPQIIKKAAGYARGMGYVLGKNNYPYTSLLKWSGRPMIGACLHAIGLNWARSRYYRTIAANRMRGYFEGRKSEAA
jgi:glycosyltransferase involved in cell wall biosynthesis